MAGLRNSVKSTVRASIENGADRGKESYRRVVAQKVDGFVSVRIIACNMSLQAIYDELVKLVDPGAQPYQPKKGKPNVIMAVGLQVCSRVQEPVRNEP